MKILLSKLLSCCCLLSCLFLLPYNLEAQTKQLEELCTKIEQDGNLFTYYLDAEKVKQIPEFTPENLISKYNEQYLGIEDSLILKDGYIKDNSVFRQGKWIVKKDSSVMIYNCDRLHKGFSVYGHSFIIHTKNGIVSKIVSNMIPLQIDTTIKVTLQEAVNIAKEYHNDRHTGEILCASALETVPRAENINKLILPNFNKIKDSNRQKNVIISDTYLLVYRLRLFACVEGKSLGVEFPYVLGDSYMFYIDALTGTVISSINDSYNCMPSADNVEDSRTISTSYNTMQDIQVELCQSDDSYVLFQNDSRYGISGSGISVLDFVPLVNWNFSPNNLAEIHSAIPSSQSGSSTPISTEATSAYYGLERAYDFFLNTFGINGYSNKPVTDVNHVVTRQVAMINHPNTCNARFATNDVLKAQFPDNLWGNNSQLLMECLFKVF